ncbi:MAG: GntR family transcriptional regulator [Deltaproteobacteria bacterium]|nr:GntR family transcriptional regulator [Deltaproteobacteria bacterium]
MIEPLSVTDSIVDYLRSKIITGELRPGQKLTESQLSSNLGISRPPIREAFRILEHERAIISIPRKGVCVNKLTVRDCQEVYKVREMLECCAIDLLKEQKISDLPEASSIQKILAGLSISPKDDTDQRLRHHKIFFDFHAKIVEAAGNSWLNKFYRSLETTLRRYQFRYIYLPGASSPSIEEHHQILSLIKVGSYEDAKKCLKAHIDRTVTLLKVSINAE